jgi:hypothetical protein
MYNFMKVLFKTSYKFYICNINNLKVIDDLYSQCLIQTLSKTTSKSDTKRVPHKFVVFRSGISNMEWDCFVTNR